ncbi:hypothetical protein N624_0159 [Levilactobacillus brevis]|nr:hypothetical protein N624_0159 [Levilactobacillus brevis]
MVAAVCTLAAVSALKKAVLLANTRDTVAGDTPANFAISLMVAAIRPPYFP